MKMIRALYQKHPLISNMVLYAGLYGSGDLSRQYIQGVKEYDFGSAVRMSIVGSCILGPFNFKWYQILDRMLPGATVQRIVQKIVADQAVSGPFGIVVFYVGMRALEGKPDLTTELQEKFWQTFKTSCIFWPCAQSVNFGFVPSAYRATYVGCMAFIWTNILSYYKSMTLIHEQDESMTTHFSEVD